MIEPTKIFVDTSAWIENLMNGEIQHKAVADYIDKEVSLGSKFFTSDYVLDETFTRLLTIQRFKTAQLFRNYIKLAEQQRNLLVLWTDETVFNKAWDYFKKFSEHKLSFTDATIYAFIKDLKIDEVLSLDQGFKKVGLTVKPRT